MKLTTFKHGSRLAIPAIFAALFLVASTVTLYYYSATLTKKGLYAIAGTQENYSWSIAKFSIKLAEFDTFVEQQSHAAQVDSDNLRLRFEILYSRFYVLETVSESTQPLYAEPGYPEVVKQMRLQMDRIDKLLDNPKIDFSQVFAAMKAIKPYAIEMANLTDHAEVKVCGDHVVDVGHNELEAERRAVLAELELELALRLAIDGRYLLGARKV